MSQDYINQLKMKALLGDAKAQYELGLRCFSEARKFQTPEERKKEYKMAQGWLKKAADNNEHHAMLLLGLMNNRGFGCDKDDDKALKLYFQATSVIVSKDWEKIECETVVHSDDITTFSQEPVSLGESREVSSIEADEKSQPQSNPNLNVFPSQTFEDDGISSIDTKPDVFQVTCEAQTNIKSSCQGSNLLSIEKSAEVDQQACPLPSQGEQTDAATTEPKCQQDKLPVIDNRQTGKIEDSPDRSADAPIAESHWEYKEPPKDEDWPKSLQTCDSDSESGLYIARRRGRSHEHDGKFCDDDGDFWVHPSGWMVLAVADGAGSAKYSREGSRIAVKTALEGFKAWFTQEMVEKCDACLQDWEARQDDFQQLFYYQFYAICKQAITEIKNVAEKHGHTERQFATTLLLTVTRTLAGKTYAASLWIGDGAMVAYRPGASRLLGAADSGEFVGQTRFLDAHYLQHHYPTSVSIAALEQVEALLLMTDGVSDPKFKSDADLKDPNCWDEFWQSLKPELTKEHPEQALLEWLHFFERGYHDDRTLLVWQAKADQ